MDTCSQSADKLNTTDIPISKGDLNALHQTDTNETNISPKAEAGDNSTISPPNKHKQALANILDDPDVTTEATTDDETSTLKVRVDSDKKGDHLVLEYHTDDDYGSMKSGHDTIRWFRMGTDRSDTANTTTSKDTMYDLNHLPTQDEQWEDFVYHLRHAASYRAEFDIYQVLAYRARVSQGQKLYFKPFKVLRGLVDEKYSDMEVRWLNSFQRVLCQAIICWSIQTIGVTVILLTQFSAYFGAERDRAQCDSQIDRWKTEWHLKLLAFLWTAFISLGVSGWIYRARHSGFYPVLLFLRPEQYPNFVSVTILQIGLLTNYYVVTSAVIGSFVLIYQTEGGTETIGMILQAVALFFVLELDNKMVHSRDFLSIKKYFDVYIKNNKHKRLPKSAIKENENIFQKPLKRCKGNSCLSVTLSTTAFMLLLIMTAGAFIAPWLIMICW